MTKIIKNILLAVSLMLFVSCSALGNGRKCDGRKAIITPMGKM